jgi:hypothetical protein
LVSPPEGDTFDAALVVPFRSVSQIDPASVGIAEIAGKDVRPLFTSPNNLGWTVQPMPDAVFQQLRRQVPGLTDNLFAVVRLDATRLAQYATSEGLLERRISVTLEGQGFTPMPSGPPRRWIFRGSSSIFVTATRPGD